MILLIIVYMWLYHSLCYLTTYWYYLTLPYRVFSAGLQGEAPQGATAVAGEAQDRQGAAEVFLGFPRVLILLYVGVIIALTKTGERTLASLPASDTAGLDTLMSQSIYPIGINGKIAIPEKGTAIWHFV